MRQIFVIVPISMLVSCVPACKTEHASKAAENSASASSESGEGTSATGSSKSTCDIPERFEFVGGACRVERGEGGDDSERERLSIVDRHGSTIRRLVDDDGDGEWERIRLHEYDDRRRRVWTEFYAESERVGGTTVLDQLGVSSEGDASSGSDETSGPRPRLEREFLEDSSLELATVRTVAYIEVGGESRESRVVWDGMLYVDAGGVRSRVCEGCPNWNPSDDTGRGFPDGTPDRVVSRDYHESGRRTRKAIDDDSDGDADFVWTWKFEDGRPARKLVDGTIRFERESRTISVEGEDGGSETHEVTETGPPEIHRDEADGDPDKIVYYEYEDGERSVDRVESEPTEQ